MGLIRNITTVLRAWLLVAVLCVVSCSKGDIQDFVGSELSDSDSSSGKDSGSSKDGKDDKGDKGDDGKDGGNGQGDTPQDDPQVLVLGYHLAPATRAVSQTMQTVRLDSRMRLGLSLLSSESQAILYNNVKYMPDPSQTSTEATEDRLVPVVAPGPSPLPAEETDVIVYAPYVDGIDGTAERTFSVPADQQTEEDFLRGDLLLGKLTRQTLTDVTPDIELKHVTARLNLNINISKGYTLDYLQGARFYVAGLKTAFNYNPITKETGAATGDAQDMLAFTVTGQESSNALLTGCLRVIPQTLLKGATFLKIVFPDGHVVTTKMTKNVELERNHYHDFTINLYGRGIDMKAELVDFETGPETTVDWDPRH